MVLFKRKPVQFLPRPPIVDDSSEVWVIPETGEVFTDYEAYLQRMDFYKQKRFICEITGHSGISFFDALRSEQAGSKEVDDAFPDALREPVLRKVQFQTISRIDNLVDYVFEELRQDFYPGEMVTVVMDDGNRFNGLVREKAKFSEVKRDDGTIQPAFARYFVRLTSRPEEEALVDDNHIVRDRKVFTKQMLRSFIKKTVTREAWSGAPWLVKPHIAEEYRIDTNVPPHLLYGNKVAEKKAMAARKSESDSMFAVWVPNRLPELKPAVKGRKSQPSQEQINLNQQLSYEEYQRAMHENPAFVAHHWGQQMPPYPPGPYSPPMGEHMPPNGYFHLNGQHLLAKDSPKPLQPPPPPKYPIEDLEIEPLHDGTHRPAIKFMSQEATRRDQACNGTIPGLHHKTVGLLLETWNTLNVYCQVIHLDSFTFDDFVDAMQFSSEEVDCELFVEAHCAILKKLVNGEHDQNGAIQISLPDLPQPGEDEDTSTRDTSRVPTPTPEAEVPAKRTRSSLNRVENASEMRRSQSTASDVKIHRAAEMSDDYDWVQRLRKRDFHNGGWQMIVVGLLHQLAGRPRMKEICDQILSHLAPLDAEPTQATVRRQYSAMDINMRAQTLQIICMLFVETKTVKQFLEESSNTMTHYRKVKIEHQRARKEAIAKLKVLNDERRLLMPDERSPSPIPEIDDQAEAERAGDMDMEIVDSEDEEPLTSRSLRRGTDRAAERKRKREQEQERKDKAAEAKQNKGSKEYQKVLKQIEKERDKVEDHEEQIRSVDVDLREADVPRTRCLGKDRFCNRYWWFERNAMPHDGLPDSSTAHAEYMNGRLWVQGPDDLEREGFIDITEADKALYYGRFKLTPAERKALEEGLTNVCTAHQWGYYENPEDVDMLIGWMDSRGLRELKLKKELLLNRDAIADHMEKRKAYLAPRDESEEPATRMSTRTKAHINESLHRCLRWKNSTALTTLGHKHVDPPPKLLSRGRKVVVDEGITTRSAAAPVHNRSGKPLTRQGTRYNF